MTLTELLQNAQFVINAQGQTRAVQLEMPVWEELLAVFQKLQAEEQAMTAYSPAVGATPTFYLAEEMPLHADLTEILARQAQGEVQLFSHQEVWDE
jgi:hypothetical protein